MGTVTCTIVHVLGVTLTALETMFPKPEFDEFLLSATIRNVDAFVDRTQTDKAYSLVAERFGT